MGSGMAMNLALGRVVAMLFALASLGALAACGKRAVVDLNSISRDKIEALATPIMRATVPARGIDVLLSIREQKGNVVTWEAANGYTFTFRDGVLIETRGIGQDLMSASAPSSGRIASGTADQRSYFFLGDDDVTERRDYSCTPQTVGTEALTIYGRTHTVRHVTESCLRSQGKLMNQFWFEGGTLRQSQQWISPSAGHAIFSRVTD